MINKIFTKARVILKNSLIDYDILGNYFLVIKNKTVRIGEDFYNYQKDGEKLANFFKEFDEERLLVLEDIMYIEFKDDITHLEEKHYTVSEMLNEDMHYFGDLENKLPDLWDFIKEDFNEFLNKRNSMELAYPYIMDILVHSTYCSYAGDGDVYYFIKEITKFNKDGEEKSIKFEDEKIYY